MLQFSIGLAQALGNGQGQPGKDLHPHGGIGPGQFVEAERERTIQVGVHLGLHIGRADTAVQEGQFTDHAALADGGQVVVLATLQRQQYPQDSATHQVKFISLVPAAEGLFSLPE